MTGCNSQQVLSIKPGLAGLTEEQLQVAAEDAGKQKISIYQSILKLGFVTEINLLTAIANQTELKLLNVIDINIDEKLLSTITANVASHYNLIPLKLNENILQLATCNPLNLELHNEIKLILDCSYDIEFVLVTSDIIEKAIRKCYGLGAATVEQMVTIEQISGIESTQKDIHDESKARDASVIKLVNQMFSDAIGAAATDIHIEPYENELRARYRIDGILHDVGLPPSFKFFREGITSRIKILSGLDIAEKRLPQDGRAQITLSKHKYDLRISILPTRHGEAINIRVLPQGNLISDLSSLGMSHKDVKSMIDLIAKPHGIILVTGPTGSGKTTTLYTCMNLLKKTDRKIITVEDPIEYDMPGIVQMQTHTQIGFTFARALRSMLRHDPDIILVGEIRDLETAETAIRTSLTGHLVFSTLHTNDAASAVTRLLDMGIEPFLIASSIDAILAQRLIRVICSNCKEPYTPEPEIVTAIKSMVKDRLPNFYRGRGCSKCRFTGFHGRTVINELLLMSEKIRQMAIERKHSNQIDIQARKEGMISMFAHGMEKVNEGITTPEEILRVTKGTVTTD